MTGQNTNNLSDAIRNLIVCDTQFGWTGETTLKLPELLDLQARGWLIEGDENNEFSLTTEGESVVARALQRADERATPSANWSAEGQPDPHGRRYACERAALALGNLTDDELANAVFLHGNEQPAMADLAAGKALAGIVYLTAAKERIRWLSRALVDATCKQPLQVGEVLGDAPVDVTDPWRGLYLPARMPAPSEYGDLTHPDIPLWPDDREDALDKLVRAQGFDFHIVAGDFTEAALEDGDELYWEEMRAWNPEAPEGEWRLAWKGDTEDGPYAWFVRPMALRPEPPTPPAQGIDLGQFRQPVEFFIAYTFPGTPSHAEGKRLLALIDQRDAAPGVGNG